MSTRKNAAYNIAYRVFSLLLPIITAPYLARTVGQEGTGLYAYAWSVSAVFVLLGLVHCGYKKIRQKAPSPIGMILLSAILGIVFWH